MALKNKATDAQIQTIYRWIEWQMSTAEARAAAKWLRDNATREEASKEIKRLYALYHNHSLTKEECFNSEVWKRYDGKLI